MAYNEKLADRVREFIAETDHTVEEKKMFGGLCFMVNGKMWVGVKMDKLLVRLDPKTFEEVVEKDGVAPMQMKDKVSKGFVFVDADTLNSKKAFEYWLKLALDYNAVAKASAKKRKGQSKVSDT